MSSIQDQDYFKQVRQFKCANCGGELTVVNARTNYVGCHYCGSVSDARSEAHQVLMKLNAPSEHPPMSFIRLGMQADIKGVKFQVLGRTRWETNYREYWEEDGESGYESGVFVYDEWLMMSQYRTYFYLIETKNGFSVSETVLATAPVKPSGTRPMTFFEGETPRPVQEYGTGRVLYFEGESTYQIDTGDKIGFSSYIGPDGATYMVEYRLEGNEFKEIEFFREQNIPFRVVAKSFGIDEKTAKQSRSNKPPATPIDNAFLYTMLAAIALWVVSFFFSTSSGVYSETLAVSHANDSIAVVTKAFQIADETKVYDIKVGEATNYVPSNTQLLIYNDQKQLLYRSELQQSPFSFTVHFPKKGAYQAYLYGFPDVEIDKTPVSFEVNVRVYWRRWLFYGFIAFLLLYLFVTPYLNRWAYPPKAPETKA